MEQNDTPHPDYQKGYNEGYILKKYMPEVADKLAEAAGNSPRGAGFRDGREQFIAEAKESRLPAWLRSDRLSNLDKETDQEKEKDSPEPER